jgi:regulatory protein
MGRSPDAFAVVVGALARRDLTEVELDQRLARAGFTHDERADALARARTAGYIDDVRVALERANRLAGRGVSNALIRLELGRRGIADEELDAVIARLGDERDRAERLVEKSGDGARAARMLARKGFPPEIVDRVIGLDIADEP